MNIVTTGSLCPSWKRTMLSVKHVTEECSLVLSSTSLCKQDFHPCFLLPRAVAPVEAETWMYTEANQDQMQLVNVCLSVIHSSLVMRCHVVDFMLTDKKG